MSPSDDDKAPNGQPEIQIPDDLMEYVRDGEQYRRKSAAQIAEMARRMESFEQWSKAQILRAEEAAEFRRWLWKLILQAVIATATGTTVLFLGQAILEAVRGP